MDYLLLDITQTKFRYPPKKQTDKVMSNNLDGMNKAIELLAKWQHHPSPTPFTIRATASLSTFSSLGLSGATREAGAAGTAAAKNVFYKIFIFF